MEQSKMKISDIKANPNNPRLYDIIGYEWIYYASESGDIYSKNWKWNKWLNILKKWIDRSGYEIVTLCKDKKKTTKTVHRLVITAILWESELYVNHKNWIKNDNCIDNLEWCTAKENIKHSWNNWMSKVSELNPFICNHPWKKKVWKYDKMLNLLKLFESAKEASMEIWMHKQNISDCCRWKKKHIRGFIYKYI